MDEKLQTALAAMIDKSMSGIDAATGFLSAEIPEVVGQLLMWHGMYNLAICIGSVLALFIMWALWIKSLMPKFAKWELSETNNAVGTYLFGNIIMAFLSLPFIVQGLNLEWLKIWIAPKVWLIEYVSQLART